MRRLFASTCLTPIALGLIASPSFAATATISAAQTTPVLTSTASSGTPADVSITSSGSITPTSGTAVTIDSNNSVTNAGTITITGANNSVGILANAGTAGTITNSGSITVAETYTRTDTNGDGVLDGPYAQGTGRYGIRTAGAFTGNVVNTGTIAVQANDSAGISLDGPLTGSLQSSGSITIAGDRSVGIRAGAVSGSVALGGSISASGTGASGVLLNGDIGGALVVQSTIASTGYSSTTVPTDTTKLTASNLLQGGPTMQIGGNIAGGALFTAASSTTDSSGNTTTTTLSSLTSYGSAPALLVGASDHAITLGSVASDKAGHGLVINGAVIGAGLYDGIAANALMIGGQGGGVTIAKGIGIGGTITATANDASATAVHIGSGTNTPELVNSGVISAVGANKAGQTSTAIQIDAGSSLPSLTNSGTIGATASNAAASAVAIVDKSGTLTSITNSGTIKANGSTATNIAIDLSAATANTTVSQPAPASGAAAPSITGDIRFGSGNDTLTIAGGSVAGNVSFGGGTNTMALSGSATYAGTADFGGGTGSLTVGGTSTFTGGIANGGKVALAVSGGTLSAGTGTTALGSLAVTGGGTLGVTIDGTTGAATLYQVGGAASFDTGSKLALHFSDLTHTVGTYTVVEAASVTGVGNLTTTGATLPWLFKSSVSTNAANNTVDVVVARKTAADLGLNRSETTAYDAIYTAISADKPVGDSFLAISDGDTFKRSLRTFLPDHAGGAFDAVSSGSRATARFLADPDAPLVDEGGWGFWLQQVGWGRTKAIDDTAGYKITGWGAAGGAEIKAGGFGRFGLSFAYLSGTNDDAGSSNDVESSQYELAAYWRTDWGHLHAWARGSAATINFNSHRRFVGDDDGSQLIRAADGHWNGKLFSGAGGLSYLVDLGNFSIRPQASIDYYHLHEGHYADQGGGTGLDLVVDGRTSDEFAANGAVALGYKFFDDTKDDGGFLRAEIEGGRRQLIGGKLGDTTASFAGGQSFTLTADDRTSGWTGALRLKGGTSGYTISGEFDGEQQQDHVAVALRAGLQVGF